MFIWQISVLHSKIITDIAILLAQTIENMKINIIILHHTTETRNLVVLYGILVTIIQISVYYNHVSEERVCYHTCTCSDMYCKSAIPNAPKRQIFFTDNVFTVSTTESPSTAAMFWQVQLHVLNLGRTSGAGGRDHGARLQSSRGQ